jgi:glycosyltransferase involved in cell wall biosynthesis
MSEPAGGAGPDLPYSVVVPTRNGGEQLLEVIAALEAQRAAPEFEIVVADDGSTDGAPRRLAARGSRRPLRILALPPRGPAAARNRAVREARGERIAFLGDDTLPAPDWLAEHERGFRARGGEPSLAVLGYTGWHSRIRVTPFLRWLNEEGLQFGYARIEDPENVPFNFFYTSNLSLARARLVDEPFDERFPYAAWEDVEAAYRLFRRGLRLVYQESARTAHDHPTDFRRFAERQARAGYCAVVFQGLHPELSAFLGVGPDGPPPLPSRARQLALEGLVRALQPLPIALPRIWSEALRFHTIRGMARAWREREFGRGGGS